MSDLLDKETLIKRLRYQGKQYSSGQISAYASSESAR
jgi:hypothetical protein